MRRSKGLGPAAITLAVTGHKDLLDAEEARASIRAVIEEYRDRYPRSPLRLISMLAVGADSIAAEAALESGARLVGLLPMDKELYLDDFPEAEDRARFERLLDACSERYEMPLPPGVEREAARAPGPARDECYAYGGAFMARQACALIAVWDGSDPGLRGGTADIVKSHLCASGNDYFRQADFLGGRQTGPVRWVRARRAGGVEAQEVDASALPFDCLPCARGKGSPCDTLYPAGWRIGQGKGGTEEACAEARRYYGKSLSSIDEFNRDALRGRAARRVGAAASGGGDRDVSGAAALHGIADALAMKYQGRARFATILLIALGTVTFAQMVFFSEIFKNSISLIAFFASLGATWIAYRFIKRSAADGKYFDYRSLAELSRVIVALRGIGVAADPTDLTKLKQQSLLSWASEVARSSSMPDFFAPRRADPEDRERLLREWVDAQASYYERGVGQRRRSLRPFKAWRFILFAGAVAVALGFFVEKAIAMATAGAAASWLSFADVKEGEGVFPRVFSWLQVAFDVLLSSGAALALYMDMRAFEDEIRLFERAAVVFRRASSLMHRALEEGRPEDFDALAVDLGREAVSENFEWNDDHRSIPLEMPMG